MANLKDFLYSAFYHSVVKCNVHRLCNSLGGSISRLLVWFSYTSIGRSLGESFMNL